MKVLVENDIRKAVSDCKPSKIAVAYIGADWKMFIPDPGRLESIIVSPTIGSNPWAIADLVKQIGWEKVAFLEELHAKMYIGKSSAVIGSANLTRNGLGAEGLIELCVEINATESLKKIYKAFEDLTKRAQDQYPTTVSKKSRLKELELNWGAAIANRIFRNNKNTNIPAFADFESLGKDHFYVLWYQPAICEYSDDVKAIESFMVDSIHFSNADKVERNKWVLTWRITDSNKPHKSAKLHWLYIHEIFENGVIDDGYEYRKCAIQRKDLDVPSPPFEITDEVVVAFKNAVQEKDIARYLVQEDCDVFSLADSLNGIPFLISKMKEHMANKVNLAVPKKQRD